MADRPNPYRRGLALAAYLTKRTTPASLDEIRRDFPGVYADGESGRKMFMRDKEELLEWGYPVVEEDDRYSIDVRDVYVPDLFLEDAERAALHGALQSVVRSRSMLRDLGATFGGFGDLADEGVPLVHADLSLASTVDVLYGAVQSRRLVEATYNGKTRVLEPWGLLSRRRAWYVHVADRTDGGAEKNLRVERFEGDVRPVGGAGAFEVPADFDIKKALPEGWEIPTDDRYDVVVRVDDVLAGRAVNEVSRTAHVERGDDGSVTVRMTVTHRAAFRSWLFTYGTHAVVLEPEAIRDDIRSWLRRVVEA
ncbi:MAG TPA: WYL domain-containing protein [Acidimicrobiales bacterium]|nr:WYL domain-containing protein [Acidimicrobiales bacterium]